MSKRVPVGVVFLLASMAAVHAKVVDDGTVIKNVTLISQERRAPLTHAVVVIRDGKVIEVGSDIVAGPHATQIDGHGGFLIPGLIDSPVHVGNQVRSTTMRWKSIPNCSTHIARSFRNLIWLSVSQQLSILI